MQIDKASRTAYRVAMRRAMHQLVDAPPIFQDPLAVQILGEDEVLLATRDAGYKRQNAGSRSLPRLLQPGAGSRRISSPRLT